ncbi:MAG: bifunctional DNA-formamidopyrimidine glycosylase/DNA-(apurinic or apyrimidinic site) lyase [Rhizobiaceae bacterium]|nr:bifunctional DNA-formamidopyrimidine glycosylase/DNA-(apurinic or apyrimidinic site) lyase [Rhizobiaceae bacterium]
MPELPEVETVKRGLAPAMEGARFDKVELNRPNLRFPFPPNFAARLKNCTINSVARRAKYLILHLDSDDVLVMHLGMSGSFYVENKNSPPAKSDARTRITAHDHVIFHLSGANGEHLVTYNDPRRFGFMDLIAAENLSSHKFFAKLGIEPTGNSLDGKCLARLLANRKAPLKAALLDQKLIAGLGNIYVCEALWQAGLAPTRISHTISTSGAKARANAIALADAVRDVIARAIAAGGSSLNDHRQTDGTPGYFQHEFNVYNRENEPCRKSHCSGHIKRIVQSGRSTYYCDSCQK